MPVGWRRRCIYPCGSPHVTDMMLILIAIRVCSRPCYLRNPYSGVDLAKIAVLIGRSMSLSNLDV